MRAVDAALLPKLLEHPPHRLHEAEVHRLVVVVEVDPAAHAGDGLAPFGDVAQDHRAALLVELVHPEVADAGGAVDAERLLGEGLDGEAVGIPAEAALDVLSAHRLVARDDVLDRAGEQVAVVRKAGGERRAVEEDELLAALGLREGFAERVVLLPEGEDALLQGVEVDLARNGLEHGSVRIGLRKRRRSLPQRAPPRKRARRGGEC